ncbi:uridine kinase [Halalkalibacillus sediminis]|uniref:Uridine kinase n=1 Tax=Halalkalibacillus sediminis TaxID=2018042 RepID=A0A2I0QR23_9BACI|nr:kinase [Halalkalibacillus sediminis]PKR76782.1 uridine kinase [Halalkalibacillus sediminis]
MYKEIARELLARFLNNHFRKRPFIVAIDGLSGSGKTTLASLLQRELTEKHKYNVSIIHIDDHIEKRDKRYNTGREEWYEYYFLQWDISSIQKRLFIPLHRNCSELYLPFYNQPTDTTSNREIPTNNVDIIIIEGIFLQRNEWMSFYDFTVFLDCPRAIRYQRVLDRDSYIGNLEERLHKYKRRYWAGEDFYMKNEQPIEKADKVYEVK